MKTLLFLMTFAGSLYAVADEMFVKPVPVTPKETIRLFNGVDFSGWTKVITAEPGSDPDKTWTIANGVIRCTGKPFGYLMTQQIFANFTLKAEYRWYAQTEQMNSGIFVLKTGPDNFFLPKAVEAQLKKGSAGDFVLLSKATVNGLDNPKNMSVKKLAASSEKPDGEWNSVEIVVQQNTVTVFINGVLQNKGHSAYTDAGAICLQSEGGAIEFRNITVGPVR
ncbi:MAG TPA: DUF1080 domain-containing protein [Kiritimatiellia bacterium]|nr:DUF1080 domain-containing protein [Kiritimatiellia bacterium]HRU70205.1 DUF1080 domain-containing protein [Kiritimatiellia bacterium]